MENEKKTSFFDKSKITPNKLKDGGILLLLIALVIGAFYWYAISQRVYSDKAEVYAPLIILSPDKPSVLEDVLVKSGDKVVANQAVAKLDQGDFVRAKTDGIVVKINDQVGKLFNPGEAIITMINPNDLRLIVHVAENKGLNEINVGQKVVFNVDAFDSKDFSGLNFLEGDALFFLIFRLNAHLGNHLLLP